MRLIVLLSAMMPAVRASTAWATEISATASADTCAPNEVLIVRVKVSNAKQASAPIPGKTEDFDIRLSPGPGNPSESTQMSMVNGKIVTNESSRVYAFDVRPKKKGRLTIPPFTVVDSGQNYSTAPMVIKVESISATGKGDVFCKIITPRSYAYLGEPVQLRLEVYVKQYKQPDIQPLGVNVMYQLCQMGACQFGVFSDAVTNTPNYRAAKLRGDRGVLEDYFIYYWDATVYPGALGPYDFGDIVVAWQYPTRLGRSFMGLQHVENPRNLRVSPELPPFEIKGTPLDNRPPDFSGAIGKYDFNVTAAPLTAPVGDPITLTLVIRGQGSMDRVSPPKLNQVEALTRDFEVSGDSLAGDITIERKLFTQTVRALREDVKQIPPLPFSYFNPETEKYETAWSKPIVVHITPAQRVALPTDVTGNSAVQTLKPLVETTEGLRANHTNTVDLLADHSGEIGVVPLFLLTAMPCIYLITWFVTRRSTRFREDPSLRRRRYAHAHARKMLNQAATSGTASPIATALLTYVADRCNAPAAGMTRADAVTLLESRNCPQELVNELNKLLEQLEMATYAGAAGMSQDAARSNAQHLIEAMERTDL